MSAFIIVNFNSFNRTLKLINNQLISLFLFRTHYTFNIVNFLLTDQDASTVPTGSSITKKSKTNIHGMNI